MIKFYQPEIRDNHKMLYETQFTNQKFRTVFVFSSECSKNVFLLTNWIIVPAIPLNLASVYSEDNEKSSQDSFKALENTCCYRPEPESMQTPFESRALVAQAIKQRFKISYRSTLVFA